MSRGRVVEVSFESVVLRDNPLGDPAHRTFPVYLPPGYSSTGNDRYPVIFLLAGFTGIGRAFLNWDFFKPPITDIIDQLVDAGKMRPAIYVMPDCITRYGGSQYVNSSGVGRYEDYIARELVPLIDSEFRTTGRRAVAGGSSGGFGSFWLAARNPDLFHAFADHCGDSAFEYCFLPLVPVAVRFMARYDYDVCRFLDEYASVQPKEADLEITLCLLCMAACFSPNAASPSGFDLPFNIRTGRLLEEVWARWLEFDPARIIERHVDSLRQLRGIYVDAGGRDQWNLFLGARQVHAQLERLGIPHLFDEHESDHGRLRREQKRKSLPYLLGAIG